MVDFPLSESMNSKDARQGGVDGHVVSSVSSRGILVVEFPSIHSDGGKTARRLSKLYAQD